MATERMGQACSAEAVSRNTVGDTEGGPKGDILGQAGAGIGTEHCLEFPAWVRAEWVRCETNSRIKTTSIYAF